MEVFFQYIFFQNVKKSTCWPIKEDLFFFVVMLKWHDWEHDACKFIRIEMLTENGGVVEWWHIALPIWGWVVCLQWIIGCHNVLSLITHVINQTAFDRAHHRTWLDASLVIKSCHIFPFHFSSLRGWGCAWRCAGPNCIEGHRYRLCEYICVYNIADSEQTFQCQVKVH